MKLKNNHPKNISAQTTDKFFELLIENSHEAIIVIDKSGIITFASQTMKNVLGYTAKSILGENINIFFPKEVMHIEREKLTDIPKGKTKTIETRCVHKNGKPVALKWTVKNYLHNAYINGFICNFYDITEQKKNELDHKYLAAIVSSSDDAIISKRLDGIITSWNKGAHKIFGYSAKEAIGKHISLIIPKEYLSQEEQIIATLKQGKHVDHFEAIRRTKSGRRIFVSLSISPIKASNGSIIGASKIARDITERKRFQEELQSGRETLALAVDAGKIGIWDWDIQHNKITWSDRVYEIHGIAKKKIIGPVEKYSKQHHPDDAERIKTAIQNALTGIKPYQEEFRIITPQGDIKWIETKAHVIRNEQGQPIRMIGATSDITQRKQLEQQKTEFIGIASHELKTPVTSIKAYAQILERKFLQEGNDQPAQMLKKMNVQLDKLTELIRDLLDVTKIETGKLAFSIETFDFNELIHEIVDGIQPTTDRHIIELQIAKTKLVTADRDRIGQVLSNFLTNAIKYSPNGKKILVSTKVTNQWITTSVQDHGVGIPKKSLQKVFERFYRITEASGQTFPGVGLGLYISSEIMKRHHGKIWVESEKNKGSTFFFSLPLTNKEIS